jgi:hypothetical protein
MLTECKLLKWVDKEIWECENHIEWAGRNNFDSMKEKYELELYVLNRVKQRLLLDCI